jgi:phosphate acetyltransferase
MRLVDNIKAEAKKLKRKVVLPESHDRRVLEAASILQQEGIANTILIGEKEKILKDANTFGVSLDGVEFASVAKSGLFPDFVDTYYEKRKRKGISLEEVEEAMHNPTFFAVMMVEKGMADGCVSGADTTTADVMRASLHIIGTASGITTISSDIIILATNIDKILSFADCAVLPAPSPEQLAEVAILTADTHRKVVKKEPKVAMLSFSTKGSTKHPYVEKVIQATEIVKQKRPDILVDGELQVDAALVPEIGERKAPGSPVAGVANVLIFPGLESGNIGYKLVQRICKCETIGPIVQGLRKPVNDLSRGCSTEDIVNLAAVTSTIA